MKLNRDISALKNRKAADDENITAAVSAIISDVRANGDEAVRRYAKKFDGFTGENLLVTEDEIAAAKKSVDPNLLRILKRAALRITDFHRNQVEKSWSVFKDDGVIMGQVARPMERVAIYVPGGTAAYPSSLLMSAIPAWLAGVPNIAVFTPVKSNGAVSPEILAAAEICQVKTIYKIGGVQAIAAAAYGTASIPKADKIVGPGNNFVATAKRLAYGDVDIDMIAGPSDVLVIADETANAKYIAADLLSQAEHGEDSSSVLVTTCETLISKVEAEIGRQLAKLSRADIAEKSLLDYGAAVHVATIEEAFDVANDLAPEHLEILTANPMTHLPKVKNAGSVFLGEHTPEPLGDYMSGTNHVLPTGGRARFSSGLGVYSFMKYSSFSYYPPAALADLKDDVINFALSEGLDAHANSVKVRFE